MKAVVVVACLIAFVSLADCLNYEKHLTDAALANVKNENRNLNKRADSSCPLIECQATGSTCRLSPSPACYSCQNEFTVCYLTNPDICACGDQFMKCVLKNATDDKTFCNPTAIYQECKSIAPSCACGNFTQTVAIPMCNQDAFCNNSTNKCQDKTGAGQTCYEDGDCRVLYDSSSYSCEENRCVLIPGTVSIGDACSTNDDCANSMNGEVSCVNGVCFGQNQGGNCTSTSSCNFGLYCGSSDLCVPWLTEGATCDVADDNCGYPLICGSGSKCIKAFTKARGQACEQDFECVSGSACINNLCAAAPAAKTCTDASDCPISQGYTGECNCNSFTGKSTCETESLISTACGTEAASYFECVFKNNCTGSDLGSKCIADKCNAVGQCFYTCYLGAAGYPLDCYPDLSCSTTTTTTGAGAAVQVSVGLVALATAVASLAL